MQMVVADADEMFVPLVNGFFVNISEAEMLIDKCATIACSSHWINTVSLDQPDD